MKMRTKTQTKTMLKPALFLLTLFLAQAVPAQQAQQGQPTLPTGTIEGTVVKVGTADGISKARVTLTVAQGSGTAQGVTADSEGKFVIRNLAAGQYRLTAT